MPIAESHSATSKFTWALPIGDIDLTSRQTASRLPVSLRSLRKSLVRSLLAAAFTAAVISVPAHASSSADMVGPGELPATTVSADTLSGQKYTLRLHHLHTGENIDIVYRIGNTYLPDALDKLNHFLRDHRTQDASHYDPKEFDLLHNLLSRLGEPNGVIDVVCGYRTPWSNNFLRTRSASTGVAKNSQHIQAKAIDIRIPGISTSKLRNVALSLHGGGVGYYPVSQFVHVDVGPVRTWTFGGRGDS